MGKGRFIKGAFLAAALVLTAAWPSTGKELETGRLRVAVWPEYDSKGVLFIYDGRFKDEGAFPATARFLIPKGAVISDACSLSPQGRHFCQLFEKKSAGDVDEVTLKLPYPNFYLSFHTDPFGSAGPGGKRELTHTIRTSYRTETLEVDVQSPLRAEGFKVVSPGGIKTSERNGLTHYEAAFKDVAKGAAIDLRLEYRKRDSRPTVDIKYSPMSTDATGNAPYERQRGARTYLYAAIAAGAAILAALLFILLRPGKLRR